MIKAATDAASIEASKGYSLMNAAQIAAETTVESVAARIVNENIEKAEQARLDAQLNDNHQENLPSDSERSGLIVHVSNPLRPKPTGTVYHDCPPLIERANQGGDQLAVNNAPRRAATGPIDGPALGRLGAAPDPILAGPPLPSQDQQQSQSRNISPNRFDDPPSHRVGPFVPIYTQAQMRQMSAQAPQTREASDPDEQVGGGWTHQGVDDLHGPILRHSPPKKRQGQRQPSKYAGNNGNNVKNNGKYNRTRRFNHEQAFQPVHSQPSQEYHWSNSRNAQPSSSAEHQPSPAATTRGVSNNYHIHTHQELRDRRDTASGRTPTQVDVRCRNVMRYIKRADAGLIKYGPCPCQRCQAKDRSAFVGTCNQGDLNSSEKIARIHAVFSEFGKIEAVCPKPYGRAVEIR